jgi:invasion protein IalB
LDIQGKNCNRINDPRSEGFSAMNFRILAASVRPHGRVSALLAATALSATLLVSGAQAQTPAPAPGAPAAAPKAPKAPKAAPKATPAPPAPAAQQAPPPAAAGAPAPAAGAQPPEQTISLIYAPWTKFCVRGQDAGAKQICFTGKDGRIESGQPVIAAVIIEPEGEPKKMLRVTLPLGMQLVHGTRVIVDNNPPAQGPYVICLQNGCMSDYEVTPELLANMKKGQNLVIQAINSNGAPLTLPLPLAEFAKAYDGPPTDPKVFEETQKKLQEELQKRAEEQRKKLEEAQKANGGGAVANPAAK